MALNLLNVCRAKPYPTISSKVWKEVNSQVWDCDVPGRALIAQPVKVILKDPTKIPHKKQYPLKPEAKAGLQPLIGKFLRHGILKPCHSPFNTPILPAKGPNGDYRMAQDLRPINEAVMPIRPRAPSPCTVLTRSLVTPLLYGIDLKEAFSCTPLSGEMQPLFAFEWASPSSPQLLD